MISKVKIYGYKPAEKQKRIDARLAELIDSQTKIAVEWHKLVRDHKEFRTELNGLATTFVHTLENEAFKALPELLKRDYDLSVEGRLKRKFVKDKEGKEIEINILGEASKNGKRFTIIGESKSQLSKKAIDEFLRRKVRRAKGVYKNIFPLLITHMITSSEVEPYAKEKGIVLYFSYDF
ncbi:hypothetical protein GWO43_00450 [candidate division KSB1 bacterium]|nr:hypothetical protein [candidate division KSB1 bacterium]NIR68536.1 hypothetical protein [candidate division KSB1 bacterium]NIS22763.1 hypothetical protein [candidate division KSB1 bacterium]NIT69394.1 hypothetical protein [candidate division KSB1 bacterium]NIU23271.1 hypothetical protein [candidate division KSB1 bacterium]